MSIYTFKASDNKYELSERSMYGSSRVGMENPNQLLGFRTLNQSVSQTAFYSSQNYTGDKNYELSNHLGNVLEVVTDRKLPIQLGTTATTDYYTCDVIAYSDYFPYGMVMPGRNGQAQSADYRYGFNGMEADDEIKDNKGTSYDFGARLSDPRVGRWLSIDPKYHAGMSPYNAMDNSPIIMMDPDGKDAIVTVEKNTTGTGGGTITISSTFIVVGKDLSPDKVKEFGNAMKAKLMNGTYIDIEGKCWDIVYDVQFVQSEQENIEDIELSQGQNILEFGSAGREHTNGMLVKIGGYNGSKGETEADIVFTHYATTGRHAKLSNLSEFDTGFHELLHLLGLSDRYEDQFVAGRMYSLPVDGWPSDPMSTGAGNHRIKQTHYDNIGRVFSGEEGVFALDYNVDVNVDTGTLIGKSQNGLTSDEKLEQSKKSEEL